MSKNESILGDISFFSEILKKSGYKSVSFGSAEIIDNAIDAGANQVLVIGESIGNHIRQIGFLDNGCGMATDVLRKCLQVGHHFKPTKTGKRRGKYGFGLPGASAAHSDIVEVYSWQSSSSSDVYKVSFDVNNLEQGIEYPQRVDQLPQPYEALRSTQTVIQSKGTTVWGPVDLLSHGTLVLWKGCERITPKTTQVLFQNHLAPHLARLFRHFITTDNYSVERFLGCNVSLVYNLEEGKECTVIRLRPNDPLYVMGDHRYANEFSFDLKNEFTKTFQLHDAEVAIRFSLSTKDVRLRYKGNNKMNTELGKNLGISIVREGREIDFGDFHFCDTSEDRNRFWGCEIMFTKGADEFFGVPANKQHVDMLKKTHQVEGVDEYPQDVDLEDIPIWLALEKDFNITSILGEFLKIIKGYGKRPKPGGSSTDTGDDGGIPGATSDVVDDEGEDDSDSTSGGSIDIRDDDARKNAIKELKTIGMDNPSDQQIARYLQHKVVLEYVPMGENTGFMDVQIKYGICILKVNTESRFYGHVLSEMAETSEESARGLELLLLAYARCMDLHKTYESYKEFPRVLAKWNSKAEELLRDYYDSK